jgi:CheY-like chemotaxis protein
MNPNQDAVRIANRKPLKILLAEDNKVNQVLTMGLLSCLGYQCDLATDGKLAIEACERKAYDLILMDCQLPLVDGYQAAKIISQREDPKPIIVAYSANISQREQDRCKASGMDMILGKPVTLDSLERIVSQVFDHRMS